MIPLSMIRCFFFLLCQLNDCRFNNFCEYQFPLFEITFILWVFNIVIILCPYQIIIKRISKFIVYMNSQFPKWKQVPVFNKIILPMSVHWVYKRFKGTRLIYLHSICHVDKRSEEKKKNYIHKSFWKGIKMQFSKFYWTKCRFLKCEISSCKFLPNDCAIVFNNTIL